MDHHHQKPRGPMTLEKFFPSWLWHSLLKLTLRHTVTILAKKKQRVKTYSWKFLHLLKSLLNLLAEKHIYLIQKFKFIYDLIFGEMLHNHPFYMVSHVLEKNINRILINLGVYKKHSTYLNNKGTWYHN